MTTAEPMAAGRRGPRARPARARRTHDPRRWLLAAAVAAWTAYFLVPAPAWAFAIVPIAAAAMLVLEAWPALAALLVLAASELVAFGAVDYGGVELLLATVAVLGHLGRVHRPLWFGAACVVAFAMGGVTENLHRPTGLLATISSGVASAAGVVFFASNAPEGQPVWAYSAVYNAFLFPEVALASIVSLLPAFARLFKPLREDAV